MNRNANIPIDADTLDRLRSEATVAATTALRNLHRLHPGNHEAVGQAMHEILTAAIDDPGEPIAIRVESLGRVEYVTLREYIEVYVQDWQIGLEVARTVLGEFPAPHVYNQEDAIRHPEYLQLHTALDERLLGTEIERLVREGDQ